MDLTRKDPLPEDLSSEDASPEWVSDQPTRRATAATLELIRNMAGAPAPAVEVRPDPAMRALPPSPDVPDHSETLVAMSADLDDVISQIRPQPAIASSATGTVRVHRRSRRLGLLIVLCLLLVGGGITWFVVYRPAFTLERLPPPVGSGGARATFLPK